MNLGEDPAFTVAQVILHAQLVLRDEDVLPKRVDVPVLRKLLSAVVSLGRLGQNLDNERRIEERVDERVFELRLAADLDYVRVRNGISVSLTPVLVSLGILGSWQATRPSSGPSTSGAGT